MRVIHLFVEFGDHHRFYDRQQFSCCGRWHAECVTEGERRGKVPADHRARQNSQLAAETVDQVPDLPTLVSQRPVQPVRAVFARRLAGLAVSVAPAEGPLGKDAETFFSCSSSRPLET